MLGDSAAAREAWDRLRGLRREALTALREGVAWQEIPDSPTTRYYTPWSRFERLLQAQPGVEFLPPRSPGPGWEAAAGPCGSGGDPRVVELLGALAPPGESRLLAAHYRWLAPGQVYAAIIVGEKRLALCEPRGEGWASQHLVIHVPAGASASVEVYAPRSAGGSTVLEAHVEKGARLRLSMVSAPERRAVAAFEARLRVEEAAEAVVEAAGSGGLAARLRVLGLVPGAAGKLHARGLGVAGEGEHVDLVLDTVQDGERSEAAAEATAVALDMARAVARGTARVTQRAKGSASRLEVEAVALGEGSTAYTAPMMLIETGDVAEASHRAAQYSSPEELLFYLRSRGLSRREAWSLVLYGKLLYTLQSASSDLKTAAAEALGARP